jgi:hypothetical protein
MLLAVLTIFPARKMYFNRKVFKGTRFLQGNGFLIYYAFLSNPQVTRNKIAGSTTRAQTIRKSTCQPA